MTQPSTFKFGAAVFYLGDGGSPEVFTKICGFTQRDLKVSKSMGTTTIPDCDDPDAAVWEASDVTSMSWSMSFTGVLAASALPLVEAAGFQGVSRNIRLEMKGGGTGSGTPNRRYSGAAHVEFGHSGSRGERDKISIDLKGDGPLVPTSVA